MVVQVKFIKFFVWEEHWIGRALDAREAEMQWMVRGAACGMKWPIITDSILFLAHINSIMFYLLWTCAPILVSIVSFFMFVMQGGELMISVAFMVGLSLFSPIWYDCLLVFGCSLSHFLRRIIWCWYTSPHDLCLL